MAMLPKGDITMEYLLHDKQGFVVASVGGPDIFEGTLSIKNPMLWWPIGMSDQPAYLYNLKVGMPTYLKIKIKKINILYILDCFL